MRSLLQIGFFLLAANLPFAAAQLRPRRVGVDSLGAQDLDAGAAADGLNGDMADAFQGVQEAMKMMVGEDGNFDMSAMLQSPIMQKMMAANPEMAEMLSNPELMQEKMKEVTDLMSSEEGQDAMGKVMSEMKSVLTDPEKLKQGLEMFKNNPMFAELADQMPEIQKVMDDPDALEETMAQAQKMFANMFNDGDDVSADGMQAMVKEQLAALMQGRAPRAYADTDEEEF